MRISLGILLAFSTLFISCQNGQTNADPVQASTHEETAKRNMDIVKSIVIEGDRKNVDILDAVCAQDYKYYIPSNAQPLNLEEHKQL